MAVSPGDPQRVYLARSPSEIEHSVDGGVTWSPCARIQIQKGFVLSLAVSPEDASAVIAGTNQGIYTSNDGCASWEGHLDDINARCPDGRWTDVDAIEFDPNLSRLIYAGTSCGVFESDDGGDRWHRAGLEDLDISALAFGRDEILAGTWGDGVWVSGDSGATWTRISTDDQNRYVNDLFVDPALRKVYSATSGNGMVVLDRWLPEPRRPSRRVPIAEPDGKALPIGE
jgi:photosystem II stability/assembly factor-like uncharacterized protein